MLGVFITNLFSHFVPFFKEMFYCYYLAKPAKDLMYYSCKINIMLYDLLKCLIKTIDVDFILCLTCNN